MVLHCSVMVFNMIVKMPVVFKALYLVFLKIQ